MTPSDYEYEGHINSFVNNNDIYYPELSFYMKHLVYFIPTIKKHLVSFKYNFNELTSQSCLYTKLSTDALSKI